MFDAVVIAGADAEPAARTFAGLVEGAVQGVLQRVVLASPESAEDLRRLAEAAGCRLALGVPAEALGPALREHLATPHVLAFSAGVLLPSGWADELRHELQRAGAPPPDGGVALRPAALGARLRLAARLAGRRPVPVAHGVLAPRASLTDRVFHGAMLAAPGGWRMARLTVERAPES